MSAPRSVPDTPAHDVDLERDVLAAFVIYPSLIDTSGVTSIDFYLTAHKLIYDELAAMRRDARKIESLTLIQRLRDVGKLEAVGGHDYVLGLTDRIPSKDVDTRRLRQLGAVRDVERCAFAVQLCARSQKDIEPALEALERARRRLEDIETPELDPLEGMFKPVGKTLVEVPPPRRWLLTRADDETRGATSCGFLPHGKVAMLAAQGGAGKTHLAISLALSVATGRRWLDAYDVATAGHVLLLLGEEDAAEVWRRLYYAGRAMRLTDAQIEQAGEQVTAVALAGAATVLVDQDGSDTRLLARLRRKIKSRHWALIIADPLSRFAHADAEKDAHAATRFVQALESLIFEDSGRPTVLVCHHTGKASRDGQASASTSNARGSTALTDGVRWCAELSRTEGGAKLSLTKSNYGPGAPPLELVVRDDGYLSVATPEETHARQQRREQAAEAVQRLVLDDVGRRVLEVLAREPNLSKVDLAERTAMRAQSVRAAVDQLAREGRIALSSRYGYSLAELGVSPQKGTSE